AHHAPIHEHRCAVTSPMCEEDHVPGHLACQAHRHLEERWTYYNSQGGYRLQQRMRAEGQDVEPADIRLLRVMFSRHMSFGHLVGSLSCGIICGIHDLSSHEVCVALDSIWPESSSRPDLLFYDSA
ncbi:unnamed protein product, partial [Ectocarpus sp. 6 AP-2014]